MASPKFNRIQVELSRRIGDPITVAAPGGAAEYATAAATAGKVLTAAERDAYINKAMHKLFSDVLLSVQGDNQKFLEIFPELYETSNVTTTAGGLYTIASPDAHFFKLIEGVYNSVYIKVLPKHFYNIVRLGVNSMYTPSASNLFAFELEGVIQFLPASSFNTQVATIYYIKKPLHTDGTFFSNGDAAGDIPFYEHWESKIAEIAEELVRIDRQFQS